MKNIAIAALILLSACSSAARQARAERKINLSVSHLQGQADFALGCPAEFVVLTHYKGWPMRMGAECGGRQIGFMRDHPKLAWRREF
jgi:hypothetical protein